MKRYISLMTLAVVCALGAWSPPLSAEAAIITNSDIAEQKEVLRDSVHVVLQEELKLVQMLFIQLLERRIEQLEARVEAQK